MNNETLRQDCTVAICADWQKELSSKDCYGQPH